MKLVGEYGLRNKRELWRVQMVLSKIRNAGRHLVWLARMMRVAVLAHLALGCRGEMLLSRV